MRAVAAYVGRVLVLDPEKHPHATPEDLGKADEEGDQARMLDFILLRCQLSICTRKEMDSGSTHRVYYVKDPIETQYWVNGYGSVVPPLVAAIRELISE